MPIQDSDVLLPEHPECENCCARRVDTMTRGFFRKLTWIQQKAWNRYCIECRVVEQIEAQAALRWERGRCRECHRRFRSLGSRRDDRCVNCRNRNAMMEENLQHMKAAKEVWTRK